MVRIVDEGVLCIGNYGSSFSFFLFKYPGENYESVASLPAMN